MQSSFLKYRLQFYWNSKELQTPWTLETNKQNQRKVLFQQQHLNRSYPTQRLQTAKKQSLTTQNPRSDNLPFPKATPPGKELLGAAP